MIGWQICSSNHNNHKSSKQKKVLKTKNRSKHVREISGTNYGYKVESRKKLTY